MKIKDIHDAKKVQQLCLEKLVGEKSLVYFSISVDQDGVISNCFFSPVSESRGANKQKMFFVDDVERLIRLLLSHPKVSDLEYDEKENMIQAIFTDELPYPFG